MYRVKPTGFLLDQHTGGTFAAESRNRWTRPPRTVVPDDFVPTIERVVKTDVSKNKDWRDRANRFWVAAPAKLATKIVADVQSVSELAGVGVLALDETATRVLLTPTVKRTVAPFSHQHWLGIVRSAADSGFQALERARRSGYRQAEEDAKARASAAAQREALASMHDNRLPL